MLNMSRDDDDDVDVHDYCHHYRRCHHDHFHGRLNRDQGRYEYRFCILISARGILDS